MLDDPETLPPPPPLLTDGDIVDEPLTAEPLKLRTLLRLPNPMSVPVPQAQGLGVGVLPLLGAAASVTAPVEVLLTLPLWLTAQLSALLADPQPPVLEGLTVLLGLRLPVPLSLCEALAQLLAVGCALAVGEALRLASREGESEPVALPNGDRDAEAEAEALKLRRGEPVAAADPEPAPAPSPLDVPVGDAVAQGGALALEDELREIASLLAVEANEALRAALLLTVAHANGVAVAEAVAHADGVAAPLGDTSTLPVPPRNCVGDKEPLTLAEAVEVPLPVAPGLPLRSGEGLEEGEGREEADNDGDRLLLLLPLLEPRAVTVLRLLVDGVGFAALTESGAVREGPAFVRVADTEAHPDALLLRSALRLALRDGCAEADMVGNS